MLAAELAENRGVAPTASSLTSHRDLDGFHEYPEKQHRDDFRRTFPDDETRISRILGELLSATSTVASHSACDRRNVKMSAVDINVDQDTQAPKSSFGKKLRHCLRSPRICIPCCLGGKERWALNRAAMWGDINTVRRLLECGANPNHVRRPLRRRKKVAAFGTPCDN
jgi:hypothetical protein